MFAFEKGTVQYIRTIAHSTEILGLSTFFYFCLFFFRSCSSLEGICPVAELLQGHEYLSHLFGHQSDVNYYPPLGGGHNDDDEVPGGGVAREGGEGEAGIHTGTGGNGDGQSERKGGPVTSSPVPSPSPWTEEEIMIWRSRAHDAFTDGRKTAPAGPFNPFYPYPLQASSESPALPSPTPRLPSPSPSSSPSFLADEWTTSQGFRSSGNGQGGALSGNTYIPGFLAQTELRRAVRQRENLPRQGQEQGEVNRGTGLG